MEHIYLENAHVTIFYDPFWKMGRAVWNGFLSGETFKTNLTACLRLIEEKHLALWLADNRKMKSIRQQDQLWLEKVFVPRLAASSLQKMATLISEDIFNQMAIETLHIRGGKLVPFDTQFFQDEEEARKWLIAPRKQESQDPAEVS
jgi:hypothetical protein